jgi:molybdopterin/thiamine biosynthesis adenylyltransferase
MANSGNGATIPLHQAIRKIAGRKFRLIGQGGIGGIVTPVLARFLHALAVDSPLYLIDGDDYELRNRARMAFNAFGNKAVVNAQQLAQEFEGLSVIPMSTYVTPATVADSIASGDICFIMVDNHVTRQLISSHCTLLEDVVLISGGNDGVDTAQSGTFGNCQLFIRHAGVSLTNPLTRFHPEIAQPKDKAPYDMSCGELVQAGVGQLLFTNLAVASAMLNAFFGWLVSEQPPYEEVYLDIRLGRVTPVTRGVARDAP